MSKNKHKFTLTVENAKAIYCDHRRAHWETSMIVDVWKYYDDSDARIHSDALDAPDSDNIDDYSDGEPCDVCIMTREEYERTVLANSCINADDVLPASESRVLVLVVVLSAHSRPKNK